LSAARGRRQSRAGLIAWEDRRYTARAIGGCFSAHPKPDIVQARPPLAREETCHTQSLWQSLSDKTAQAEFFGNEVRNRCCKAQESDVIRSLLPSARQTVSSPSRLDWQDEEPTTMEYCIHGAYSLKQPYDTTAMIRFCGDECNLFLCLPFARLPWSVIARAESADAGRFTNAFQT
jgi:hypothetical protein